MTTRILFALLITAAPAFAQQAFTNDETAVLKQYTDRLYLNVNSYLRNGTFRGQKLNASAKKELTQKTIPLLLGAMEKLPDYSGTVYRGFQRTADGLKKEYEGNLFTPGKVISDRGFLSTSRSLSIVEQEFAGVGGVDGSNQPLIAVILTIHSHTGRDIMAVVTNSVEQEVDFLPNTKFRVISQSIDKDGHRLVELEEI